ncbi:MAG: uridylate kinase, partial [Methylobacter sp.]|nr:uridylate kinase [Methylobacter sp.]
LNAVEKNYQGRVVVIVPGGGAFADQVRLAQQHWQFDDHTAHRMALLAMQQTALMLKGLKADWGIADKVAAIYTQLDRHNIVIWSPDSAELDSAGIAASWDISSDSLAAWLAYTLSANELILVKSAVIDDSLSLHQLAEQQIVDKAFCGFAEKATFTTQVINVQRFLRG